MRKQKSGQCELVRIEGSSGAVFEVDLTPRVQKLIERGKVKLLEKSRRGRGAGKDEPEAPPVEPASTGE